MLDVHSSDHLRGDEATGFDQLLCRLENITTDLHDPQDVVIIGSNEEQADFIARYKERFDPRDQALCEAGVKHLLLAANEPGADGLGPVCHFLASEKFTDGISNTIRSGAAGDEPDGSRRITTVILAWPAGEEEHERHLPRLLEKCPDVTVVVIHALEDPIQNGIFPRTEILGYEGVPANVDFDASGVPDDEEIPILPLEAMHGKAAAYAKMLQTPIGFAYLAILAVLSLFVKSTATIRAALFVSLMGPVRTGKSLTSTRARVLFGLAFGGVRAEWCVDHTPASDRGLYRLFPGPEPKKRLLELDEQRDMMAKGSIENSSMFSALCKLWSQNHAGAADKQGLNDCCVELSILGDLKIDNPSEFPGVFTHQTAHGLYDRQLFGVRAGEKWRWTNVEFDPMNDIVSPEVSEPRLTQPIIDLKNAWQDAGKDRDRLAELALRVALITSAVNRDPEITVDAMTAALKLMEWQEKIRRVYSPAKGANEFEECVIEIEDTFRAAPGRALNWREISQRKNWHRRFPRAIRGMKKMLMDEGKLGFDKKSGKHYLNEVVKEKRS